MSSFSNHFAANDVYCQTLKAQDGIETPSLKINGVVFNADVTGAVTLPYLEGNYVQKADANILNDITGTSTDVTVAAAKTLRASKAVVGDASTGTLSTTMNATGDLNVPNIGFVRNEFANKANTYSKTDVTNLLQPKLNSSDLTAYQQQVNTQLAGKANANLVYSTQQIDGFLTSKADTTQIQTVQGQLTTLIAGKANIGDSYTKSQSDNLVSGKADIVQLSQGLAGKVDNSAFTAEKTQTAANLATKVDTAAFNTAIGQKLDTSLFDTYQGLVSTTMATKATKTELSDAQTNLTGQINLRANSADVYSKSTVDNLVIQRVTNSDFNTYKASNTLALNEKVNTTDFNAYQGTNSTALASKANSADVYPKTATYSKSEVDTISNGKQNVFSNATFLTGIDQSLSTTASPTFANIISINAPSQSNQLANKSYVDAQASTAAASTLAGTGLIKTGNTIAVNSSQPTITSLGSLTGLTVSGNTSLQSLQAAQVSIPYTTAEQYVSGFRLISTGVGNGNYLQSHNARATGSFEPLHISDHGGTSVKLSFLADRLNFPLTTQSTSTTSGALTIAGGIAIAKDAFIGGNEYLVNGTANSNAPNLFLNNNAGGTGNAVSINLNPNNQRTGGSAVILSAVDNGNTDAYFSLKCATGSTSAVASQIIKASASTVQVSGQLSCAGLTASSNVVGATGIFSNTLSAPVIGLNVASSTYPLHALSPVAANVNLFRLAMPNLGTTSPISTSIAYGCDGFGTGDISARIAFIRENSAASSRTAIGFSTAVSGTAGTDYAVERVRINSDGDVSIFCTINATSSTTGALKLAGGAGIAQNLHVGGELNATGNTRILSTLDADRFYGTTAVAALTVDGGLSVKKASCFGDNIFVKGAISPMASDGRILGGYGMFGVNNTEPLPTFTSYNAATAGCYDFWDNTAGTRSLAIRKDVSTFSGKVAASNLETGMISGGSTQAGVTMTKVVDANYWTRLGRVIECYINLQLSSLSGTQSGPLTFTLPYPSSFTGSMENVTFVSKNGGQLSLRFNFTAGSSSVNITQNNGFGTYVSTTPNGSDNWTIILTYPANSGSS